MEWILTTEKQNEQLADAKKIVKKVLDEIDYGYDNYGPIWNALDLITKAIEYEEYLKGHEPKC